MTARFETLESLHFDALPPAVSGLPRPFFVLMFLLPFAAFAQNNPGPEMKSPRWSYEVRIGSIEPDLDDFGVFYGDDYEEFYGLGASIRIRDWLEVGAELGHMKARGAALLTSSNELGSYVEYQLNPVQVYSNFVFQRHPMQRFVPYGGIGLSAARYDQSVHIQGSREGMTDVGYSARLGLRFLITIHGSRDRQTPRNPFWRSYAFLEANELSMEKRGIDLGGLSYLLGFRMEFD